jgi:hypothetical protein
MNTGDFSFLKCRYEKTNLNLVTQTLQTKVETLTKTNGTQTLTIKHKSDERSSLAINWSLLNSHNHGVENASRTPVLQRIFSTSNN